MMDRSYEASRAASMPAALSDSQYAAMSRPLQREHLRLSGTLMEALAPLATREIQTGGHQASTVRMSFFGILLPPSAGW